MRPRGSDAVAGREVSPPLGAEQASAVAGVVVLQHGGRVAPGVPRAGRVPHGCPALPALCYGLPRQRLVARAAGASAAQLPRTAAAYSRKIALPKSHPRSRVAQPGNPSADPYSMAKQRDWSKSQLSKQFMPMLDGQTPESSHSACATTAGVQSAFVC